MSIENVNTVNSYNDYYVQPKKTCTNRIGMTSIGLASAGTAVGYLLNEPKNRIVNGITEETLFKGKFNPRLTNVEEVLEGVVNKKSNNIARYLPLAAISLAFVLGCFGLGAALDNSKYNRKIKKAQKNALKLQEQALDLQIKQKVINAQV